MKSKSQEFSRLVSMLFRAHPWHSVAPHESQGILRAYIEIVPNSHVKLELDKPSGHLSVDRPQRYSALCPTLYGFVPQSYCGDKIGAFCAKRTKRRKIEGDGDPLDICVLTEKDFSHGDLFLKVHPIGGLRMIDKGQADDKIVAVLLDDAAYGDIDDISECPPKIIERLKHYFLSYKQIPGEEKGPRTVEITDVYGRKEAEEVIRLSFEDYQDEYGQPEERLDQLRHLLASTIEQTANGSPKRRKKR